MNLADVFRQLTQALEHSGIPYMLTGSFASNLYGSGRATQDIDLVIAATPEQMQTLHSFFPKTDYYFDLAAAMEAARRRSMFNILDMVSGWKIDLIFLKSGPYHGEAFKRRKHETMEGIPVIAASAEDLIIAKLDWARMGESSRQIEDVAGVLKSRNDQLDYAYLERWIKELALSDQWSRARHLAGLE